MTSTESLVVGIVLGAIVGGVVTALWWRARYAQIRGTAVNEVSQASAKSAAEQAAVLFRQIEDNNRRLATEELERRQSALNDVVAELVRPVSEQLKEYKDRVDNLQSTNARLQGELKNQLEQLASANANLQRETGNLVSALRRPEVRGGWGEHQLRRIVELAGMVEHCDFDEQVAMVDGMGDRQRPDVVVHLPNQRELIVDSKVPLDAYLDGLAASDQETRDECMRRHAAQLKSHVELLAKKSYQSGYKGSIDFVVAFIPGDPLLAAAFEYDPSIFERAIAENVIIATPTTLIALLKAVAFGWQQEAVTRNTQEIAAAAKELYGRLRTVATHLSELGNRLRSGVEAYNKLVGSFERRLMPQARRFEDLQAIGVADSKVPEPQEIAEVPLTPRLAESVPVSNGDGHSV
ncbi:MAG: DNA recombination protein RmuC [Acidimicrobiales bacterium]